MKAMILAASQGTRIRPLTYTLAKSMIPLINKPVMESVIEHLALFGIKEMVINTSHLAPTIENYFRDGQRLGVQIAYSFEGHIVEDKIKTQPLGSAGGMKKIQDFSHFFDETFIVISGDAVVDVDLAKALHFHREKQAIATVIMHQTANSVSELIQINQAGKIISLQKKSGSNQTINTEANAVIYLFEPEVFAHIPSQAKYDIWSQLLPQLLEKQLAVYAISLSFNRLPINSIPDYWRATQTILKGEVKGYQIAGKKRTDGIYTGINLRINFANIEIIPPVYIGSSTSIGDGAKIIGPTVIGANCVIEAGAVVAESLIADYTRVASVAKIENMLIFANQCINPMGEVLDIEEADIGWLISDARKVSFLTEEQRYLFDIAQTVQVKNYERDNTNH
jgi:mannose-1-phosphate guanylyltransferase